MSSPTLPSSCCCNTQHSQHTQPASAAPRLAEKPYVDPVCGRQVAANPDKAVVHEETTYYVCCQGCVIKFRNDPQRYLSPRAPIVEAPAGTTFTSRCIPRCCESAPVITRSMAQCIATARLSMNRWLAARQCRCKKSLAVKSLPAH